MSCVSATACQLRGHHTASAAAIGTATLGSYALAVDGALNGLGIVLWKATLHHPAMELRAFEPLAVDGPLGYFLLQRAMPSHAPAAGVAASLVRAARG